MKREQGRKNFGDEWQFSWILFLVGIGLALLFLFANRASDVFCDVSADGRIEAPAACVRSWIEALGPWAAIVAAVATLGPIVGQWQQMRRQTLISLRAPLLSEAQQLRGMLHQVIDVMVVITEAKNAPKIPHTEKQRLSGEAYGVKSKSMLLYEAIRELFKIDNQNYHNEMVNKSINDTKQIILKYNILSISHLDEEAMNSAISEVRGKISDLLSTLSDELEYVQANIGDIDRDLRLRRASPASAPAARAGAVPRQPDQQSDERVP